MTPHQITSQLERIASAADFAARSAQLADAWTKAGAGPETVEPVLRFIEEHPSIDFGMPGPLVHFVERFYQKGYERKLLESVERKPTPLTAWMLNRLINGSQGPEARLHLINAMERAKSNPLADSGTKQILNQFLERFA